MKAENKYCNILKTNFFFFSPFYLFQLNLTGLFKVLDETEFSSSSSFHSVGLKW